MKIFLCLFLIAAANATTVYIGSNAFDTTNNSGDPTVDLPGMVGLPGSAWVSDEWTGDHDDPGYFSIDVVTFTTTFKLDGTITSASLIVLGDILPVVLNGHSLPCGPIGCVVDVFTFAALSPYLMEGTNTLSFGVVQIDGLSLGLDFGGTVTTSETPEPAMPALIGAGLLALAALRRRRQIASGNLKQDARQFSPI